MTLQWTFVATILYIEIFLVFILLIPFISLKRWRKILHSNLLSFFGSYYDLYFWAFSAVLVLLFAASVKDVTKFNSAQSQDGVVYSPEAKVFHNMNMFRAHRSIFFLFHTKQSNCNLAGRQISSIFKLDPVNSHERKRLVKGVWLPLREMMKMGEIGKLCENIINYGL